MSVNQAAPTSRSTYVLNHSVTEIRRLLVQGRLYDDFTEHALRLAGLRPGMRVLDVGCGPGDVSFVAARLVGPAGTVLGVDVSDNVIQVARGRAAEQGLDTVRFESTAIADISLNDPVDAVIGRFILMHLPDPVATLRDLAAMVRPGGLIAFCESDITAAGSIPDLPLWQAVKNAVAKAFRGMGLDPALGRQLHMLFRQSGLTAPRLTLGAPMERGDDSEISALAVETWRAVLPTAERLGAIPDELADLNTLRQRLRNEAATAHAVAVMPALICASVQV
jgi:2-polyprenyl-3-methyl-5-hydroxy-6-metoxy-1,4-benzoquinol methylase